MSDREPAMDERFPNLIVAGVSKGGTTTLAGYLGRHQDVCLARSQEVFYALAAGASGEGLRPYRDGYDSCRGQRYLCEHGATYYFGGEYVVDAIKRWQPEARILMTVRDPVDRLWSAYNYIKGAFRLPRETSFEDYISEAERRRDAGLDTLPDPVWRELAIGHYDQTVVPWIDAFGTHLRVVFFERWTKDPVSALRELWDWLGIPVGAEGGMDLSKRNRTVLHRNRVVKEAAYALNRRVTYVLTRTPRLKDALRRAYYAINADPVADRMRPETRESVRAIYAPSNAHLARALRLHGYEWFPDWLEEPTPSRLRSDERT